METLIALGISCFSPPSEPHRLTLYIAGKCDEYYGQVVDGPYAVADD